MWWVDLQYVIVVFPCHTHLLFGKTRAEISNSTHNLLNHDFQWGLDVRKPVFGCLRSTKAQTSAFVIHVLESIISKLATGEISDF